MSEIQFRSDFVGLWTDRVDSHRELELRLNAGTINEDDAFCYVNGSKMDL